jgi:hypothetical protein
MSDLSEKSLSQARQSRTKWAEKIESGPAFSFDTSWSQRRQANHCFGAFMDCKHQEFVVLRSFGRQKKFVDHVESASKAMESCILRRDEITAFVHDQDATASAILVERGWKLDEHFDKNHVVKSWERIF